MVKPHFKIFNTPEDEIDFVKFSGFFFKLVFYDFNPLTENAKWQEIIRHVAKILFIWFGMICVIVAIAKHVAYSTILAPDFVKAAANIPSVMSKVLVVFKTWTSLRHRGDIWNLIHLLGRLPANYEV